jgi:hypothetical protein
MTSLHFGLPTLWEIAWYWNGLGEHDPFCVDLSRPACAGCGFLPSGRDQRRFKHRWTACHLERGHLVNACLGGPDTVENLVPLCWWCNRSMPYFDRGQLQAAMDWVLGGGWLQNAEVTEEGYVLHGHLLARFADF